MITGNIFVIQYKIEQLYNDGKWRDPGDHMLFTCLPANLVFDNEVKKEPFISFHQDKEKALEVFEILKRSNNSVQYRLIEKKTEVLQETAPVIQVDTINGIKYACFPCGKYYFTQIQRVFEAIKSGVVLQVKTFKIAIDPEGCLLDWLINNEIVIIEAESIYFTGMNNILGSLNEKD